MLSTTVLAILVCIMLIGIMFPYGFPLFILILLPCIGLFVVQKKRFIIPKELWPLLVIQMVFFLAIPASERIFSNFVKEFINILSMDLFLILLFTEVQTQEKLSHFLAKIENIMLGSSFVIAVIGIYKFVLLLQGQLLSWVSNESGLYPWGTSLVTDYNSFSLGLSIGLLFTFKKISKNTSILRHILFLLIILIFIACIISSGSRRGLISIPVILMSYTYLWIRHISSPLKTRLKKIATTLIVLTGIVVSIMNTQGIDVEINTNHIETLVTRFETLKDRGQLSSSRAIRWEMSYDMLNNETSIRKILFGNGFNYLHTFNLTLSEIDGEDYPHNILLSSLLYSGIVGTLALIMFLGHSSWLMFQVRHQYFEWALFFLLMLLTLFTSANTIFSSKVIILILSIPTLFYRINRHDVTRHQSPHSI